MKTIKSATAAVVITQDNKAVSEPLYAGKDLLEIFPNAKKILLFHSVTQAAYFAAECNAESR